MAPILVKGWVLTTEIFRRPDVVLSYILHLCSNVTPDQIANNPFFLSIIGGPLCIGCPKIKHFQCGTCTTGFIKIQVPNKTLYELCCGQTDRKIHV